MFCFYINSDHGLVVVRGLLKMSSASPLPVCNVVLPAAFQQRDSFFFSLVYNLVYTLHVYYNRYYLVVIIIIITEKAINVSN